MGPGPVPAEFSETESGKLRNDVVLGRQSAGYDAAYLGQGLFAGRLIASPISLSRAGEGCNGPLTPRTTAQPLLRSCHGAWRRCLCRRAPAPSRANGPAPALCSSMASTCACTRPISLVQGPASAGTPTRISVAGSERRENHLLIFADEATGPVQLGADVVPNEWLRLVFIS